MAANVAGKTGGAVVRPKTSGAADPSRRQVLRNLAIGAMTTSLAGRTWAGEAPAKKEGKGDANEKIVVGLVGCGGMGVYNMTDFKRSPLVRMAAVCDVDSKRCAEGAKAAGDAGIAQYKDYRQLIDRKDIDVVICGTPDHWHGLVGTYALQAGKDLYCEKPLTHNIGEGRIMVEAAKRYGRVTQIGTQQRSGEHFQKAVEIVRSGKLGPISLVRTWNSGNEAPDGLGNPADGAPPPEVDYDMWLGPAPKRPFNKNRFHYQWRYFFDYGGGMVTDWGVHVMDVALWALNMRQPLSVSASGGKFGLKDNRDVPDTIEVLYDYGDLIMTYTNRNCNGRVDQGVGYGTAFFGTEGTLVVNRGGFEVFPEMRRKGEKDNPRMEGIKSKGSDQHWPHVQNFIECVKSRKRCIADIEDIHISTTVCNLGNIAYHTGRRIYWDAEKQTIIGDEQASRLMGRVMRPPYTL
jgi:predicted dehydrogenase